MSNKTFKYKPIYPGFPWELTMRFVASPEVFPEDATFKANFRVNPNSGLLAEIDSATGGFVRLDGNRVALRLTGAQTAAMAQGHVQCDLIRTDQSEDIHLGIRLRVPVEKSI